MDSAEIDHRFSYHPPRSHARVGEHETVRGVIRDAAHALSWLPDGRERSLAYTALEEAMFWANAAVARAEDPDAEVPADEAAAGPP